MLCSDCNIEMEEIEFIQDKKGNLIQSFLQMYQCPNCEKAIDEAGEKYEN